MVRELVSFETTDEIIEFGRKSPYRYLHKLFNPKVIKVPGTYVLNTVYKNDKPYGYLFVGCNAWGPLSGRLSGEEG